MFEIKDKTIRITGTRGSNFAPGRDYFDFVLEDGSSCEIDMRIIKFCLVVLAHDTKIKNIDELLAKKSLWNPNAEKKYSLKEVLDLRKRYQGIPRRCVWNDDFPGYNFDGPNTGAVLPLADAMANDWYLSSVPRDDVKNLEILYTLQGVIELGRNYPNLTPRRKGWDEDQNFDPSKLNVVDATAGDWYLAPPKKPVDLIEKL